MTRNAWRPAQLGSLLLVVAGCGGGADGLAPLAGTVSLGGRPLEAGIVQFVPEAASCPAAVGRIENGRFTAETAGRSGAVPGRYRIRVESRARPADETDTLPKSLVADRYLDAARSGLSCEVVAGGANVVDLDLEAAP